MVGAGTDVGVFFRGDVKETGLIVALVVIGSIVSKFASGFVGARIVGFNPTEALLFGVSSIPQLSTTLAVAFSAFSFGFIDQTLVTAMVTLSVVTVLISPTLLSIFWQPYPSNLHRFNTCRTQSGTRGGRQSQQAIDNPGTILRITPLRYRFTVQA